MCAYSFDCCWYFVQSLFLFPITLASTAAIFFPHAGTPRCAPLSRAPSPLQQLHPRRAPPLLPGLFWKDKVKKRKVKKKESKKRKVIKKRGKKEKESKGKEGGPGCLRWESDSHSWPCARPSLTCPTRTPRSCSARSSLLPLPPAAPSLFLYSSLSTSEVLTLERVREYLFFTGIPLYFRKKCVS